MPTFEHPSVVFSEKSKPCASLGARIFHAGGVLQAVGGTVLRNGLVLVVLWIGAMKFTAFEAAAIQPLVSSSPFLRWLYALLSVQAVSNLFGIVEIGAAVLIAIRPWIPHASAVGSAIAAAMFLTTLTFLFSLPGWEPSLGGFPALSSAGGFLIKDIVLLGAALWSLGESLSAIASQSPMARGADSQWVDS